METRQACSSFKLMPTIPYNIILKLATDESTYANNLWKLLKYPEWSALSKPSLTFEEKMALVWTPEKMTSTVTQDDFNVFLKPLVADSLNTDTSQTQLKIYRYDTLAIDHISSIMLFEFDVLVNEKSSMIMNEDGLFVEKTDYMEMLLLELLNGFDVGVGSSYLSFTRFAGGGNCRSTLNINNAKAIYGRSFLLALRYIDDNNGGACS